MTVYILFNYCFYPTATLTSTFLYKRFFQIDKCQFIKKERFKTKRLKNILNKRLLLFINR